MADDESVVLLEWLDERVVALTMNLPATGNAVSSELVHALDRAWTQAEQQADVIVVRSSSKHFSTGFDLQALDQQSDDALLGRFVRLELFLQRVAACSKATVAWVHGAVFGAGADLAIACKHRWCDPSQLDASQWAFPGAGFGVVLGTRRLAEALGVSVARDVIHAGRVLRGAQALELGLLTQVVTADDLPAQLISLRGQQVRLGPTTASALAKALQPALLAHAGDDLLALASSIASAEFRPRLEAHAAKVRAARNAR